MSKIEDIAICIGSGITPLKSKKEYWNSRDILWLKTEQLGRYKIYDTNEYISKIAMQDTKIKLFPKNTISVAMYGEGKTRGSVSILNKEMTTNQACCNIVVDEEKADYRYVYYWLKNNYVQLRALSSGVRKNLNADNIKNFEIDIKNKQIQIKIGELLSKLDDKIENNNKIISELEQMAKTIYDYWFLQFEFPNEEGKSYKSSGGKMVWNEELKQEIPEGWNVDKVKKYIKHINTGLNPRDNFKLGNGYFKYITVKNLTVGGTINFNNCDIIDEEARQIIHNRSQISKGDILFASIAPLGRCVIIQEEPKEWDINESVFSIRPNYEKISSEYLYMVFMSDYFVKKAEHSSAGSIFNGIRINTLENMKIVIPDKKIMTLFTNSVNSLLYEKYLSEKENIKLTQLRDYLLPLLMNGQVGFKETNK